MSVLHGIHELWISPLDANGEEKTTFSLDGFQRWVLAIGSSKERFCPLRDMAEHYLKETVRDNPHYWGNALMAIIGSEQDKEWLKKLRALEKEKRWLVMDLFTMVTSTLQENLPNTHGYVGRLPPAHPWPEPYPAPSLG